MADYGVRLEQEINRSIEIRNKKVEWAIGRVELEMEWKSRLVEERVWFVEWEIRIRI